MKKINWMLVMLVLIGFVLGGFIGNLFSSSWLNYGQTFGLTSPVILDLGFIVLTFGLTIQITISSIIGVVLSLLLYKFIWK